MTLESTLKDFKEYAEIQKAKNNQTLIKAYKTLILNSYLLGQKTPIYEIKNLLKIEDNQKITDFFKLLPDYAQREIKRYFQNE